MTERFWKEYFDGAASTYEEIYDDLHFWRLYHEITWTNIKKYLPEDKSRPVLDAGGGSGFWARKLAEREYRVVCTDISEGMLREGKRKVSGTSLEKKISFIGANITEMGLFPTNYFSLVLAEGDPISYCENPKKAIQEMVRVAQKNSHVIASVDSFFGALWRMFQSQDFRDLGLLMSRGNTTYQDAGEQHNFTVEELRLLFQNNGLDVIDIIAKPMLTTAIPWDKMENVLADQSVMEKILGLELRFNNNPSIVGFGNHLEIVGRKI